MHELIRNFINGEWVGAAKTHQEHQSGDGRVDRRGRRQRA